MKDWKWGGKMKEKDVDNLGGGGLEWEARAAGWDKWNKVDIWPDSRDKYKNYYFHND